MLTNLLLLDIETVPAFQSFTDMDLSLQRLFSDKISKTVPEDMEPAMAYRKKAGILAEFGEIICISTAFFYLDEKGVPQLKIKSLTANNEVELLRIFTDLCDKMYRQKPGFQFAGHNIREFDIPYICRRLLINALPLPSYLALHQKKPWEVAMFDTLQWWKFGDHKNYVSLQLLARVLGIPGSKDDMDGSMVQDVYYQHHDLPRIVRYCEKDVIVVANIILRFLHQPLLKHNQVTIVPTNSHSHSELKSP